MKALSLSRPWPRAILELGKRIENRSDKRGMPPMMRYRGPLLLHAAQSIDGNAVSCMRAMRRPDVPTSTDGSHLEFSEVLLRGLERGPGPTGIVGCCNVVGNIEPWDCSACGGSLGNWRECTECEGTLDYEWAGKHDLRWWFGGWALILADVRALQEPIPCRGWQGLWTPPPDVLAAVNRQTAAGRFAECRP